MENKNYNDGLEFRQIVLSHIKRILEISSRELKDHTKQTIQSNLIQTLESEDTRLSYIQSIENLAYVLLPYFDKDMKKVYEECIEIINLYGFKIREKFKKEFEELGKHVNQDTALKVFAIQIRLKYGKKLFRELNLLLYRVDYLKATIYGEDRDEVAEED